MTAEKRADHLRLVHREAADAPPLPDEEPGKELEPLVYEGEVVDPPSDEQQVTKALQVRTIGQIVHVQPSEQTIKVARVLGAEAATVAQGWHSWWVRAWGGLFFGTYRKQIRIADETGNQEALALWQDRKEQAVQRRRDRLLELPKVGLSVLKVAVSIVALLLVLIPLVAVLVWMTGGDGFAVFRWVGGFIGFVFDAIAFLALPALIAGALALLVASRREGQRKRSSHPHGPARGGDPNGERRNVFPDEGAIVKALQHLGIAELNKAFKAGWRPRVVTPTCRDGKGWRTQLEPPYGVTVEMIVQKKKVLAHNLARFPVEVWPTEPKAGVLDLWVADQGSLTGPISPWPLLVEGTADYFRGVPIAVNIRGKAVVGRLFEANYAIAGKMGSGKSTLIITLLLGALLDPLVIADVFVMAVNSDYDPMKPRLRTLLTGTGEEVVETCMNTLREAYRELDVRGKALQEHGARANSRELAEKDQRLRPRVIVIDECQALFMHEEYGEEAVAIATKLEFAARKYGLTLIYATPEPTSDSLPRKLVATSSNQACFAIGDQIGNDAVLGTGSYKAGISAVGLKPKTDDDLGDVGTCVARGFESNPGLLRCHYVGVADARTVVERALSIREKAGVASAGPLAAARARDLLDDLDQTLGAERVKLADVPGLLRKLAPNWLPYQSLTGVRLKDILTREHGVKVPNAHNVFYLDPAEVRRVRALREAGV